MSDLEGRRVLAQFKSEDGVLVGTPFDLPLDVTRESLAALCNAVLENVSSLRLATRKPTYTFQHPARIEAGITD